MTLRRLAIVGANGMLAKKVRELAPGHFECHGFDLPEFDITDRSRVFTEIMRLRPGVIINCAAYTNVDGCESEEGLATRVNGDGPGYLAEAAKIVDALLVHISTDYVFDGTKRSPYLENDPVGPLSAYGRSKLAGEQAIVASGLARFFIIRTSWLYGPNGKNFVETIIRLAQEREELRIVADQVGSPTYTGDLAEAIFRLLAREEPLRRGRNEETVTSGSLTIHDGEPVAGGKTLVTSFSSRVTVSSSPLYGIYHFANEGQCSWHEFAEEIVGRLKGRGESLAVRTVLPIRTDEYPLPARRPAYSVFSKDKYRTATGAEIPGWRESVARYLEERDE